MCDTVSELYEKIATVWAEQRYTAFLIEYDDQHHCPSDIQIKNLNDSGYNYTVLIRTTFNGDEIDTEWW
jgi:hypothetical protein